ncbi:DEAD/DEAH box helicase [Alteromonas sp. A081]|uniref:DEAD/DEAH box helicase n=1 Tax=Alteromonas sp. A081 TaxID=3410269 RepID=UPI003B981524
MITQDLRHLTQETIIEVAIEEEAISALDCKQDISFHIIHDELFIKQNDLLAQVTNAEVFDNYGDIEHFIWIPISKQEKKVLIQTIPCLPNYLDFHELQVSVDENIIEQVSKLAKLKNKDIDSVAEWLKSEFVLEVNNQSKVLTAVSNASVADNRGLTIVGKNSLLEVQFTPEQRVWAKSVKKLHRKIKFNLSSLDCELSFVDYTVASRIEDPLIKQKLEDLNRDNSTYINLWNRYNQKVKEKAVELANKAGFVRYIKIDKEESVDGVKWKFYFKEKDIKKVEELAVALREEPNAALEINKRLPSWLENNIGDIGLEKDEKVESIAADFLGHTNQYISLNLNSYGKPEKKGVIYLSISGSIVQMQRREQARDAITSFSNPMKDLRLLIEDQDFSISRQKQAKNKLKPLTATARRSFKGEPTAKQIEALDVALNTPDIALILGPPGTGKTQVISALQNRLAEEHKNNLTGQILLTSFQNDAVDNVIARSEAFGIPAIRADDNKRAPFLLEKWSKKQTHNLTEVANELAQNDSSYKIINNIRKDIAAILASRVAKKQKHERIKSLLEDVDNLRINHGFDIPQSLKSKLEQQFNTKANENKPASNSLLLRQVRGLRTSERAYDDDGYEQSFKCLSALRRAGRYESEIEVLSEIIEKLTLSAEDFEKLREVKNKLLDDLIPDYRPSSLQVELSKDEMSTLHQLNDVISKHALNCAAGIPDVIEEYLDIIKYQPDYLEKSVRDYTTSIGASCQRSAGQQVVKYKEQINASLNEVSGDFSFDTVIVDEAARANPLDLFIPMALAAKRIVLVGDHFQLPQMLEPDIEKEMIDAGDLQQETAEAIKMSLFEKLYTQLKARQAKDGIQRTVMLDTQFRMHPDIGGFVSRSFYEAEKEPKIKAGLSEEYFDIGIAKYRGKVAEWIDLPLLSGKEQRSGTSWQRDCEAQKVVSEVQELFAENPHLSVGVITFFAAQRELILNKLAKVGICQQTKDGWEYLPGYKTTDEGEEKIRVGSVDAFQGKEFDVVILSTVRSNNISASDENTYRKKYGFIRTPNRLNVAFSRAKSLIKVVGDKAMFSGETAEKAIPQVWAFIHELCEVKS